MNAPLTDEELAGLVKICESRTRYGIPAVMMDVGLISRALEEVTRGREGQLRRMLDAPGGCGKTEVVASDGAAWTVRCIREAGHEGSHKSVPWEKP